MKLLLLVSLFVLTSGCGTLNSNFLSDQEIRGRLEKANTHCESITRVYSGFAYNFCLFHAEPETIYANPVMLDAVPLLFFDFFFSGVLDTVFLPYTIYKQGQDGSLILQ